MMFSCRDFKQIFRPAGIISVFLKRTADGTGSILALVLIVGASASILGLAFMHYSLTETRTAGEYKATQVLFCLAESGIEKGLAALQADPGRREPLDMLMDTGDPSGGFFRVDFYCRNTAFDSDEYDLPLGYDCITDLTHHDVFIRSEGIIPEGGEEKKLELWALAENDPLYNKALFCERMLALKGLSKGDGLSQNAAGIYGDVHLNGRLYIEAGGWTDRNYIRKCPVREGQSMLTYSTGMPRVPVSIWSYPGTVQLFVETEEGGGGQFIAGEGENGEGGWFLKYERPATSQRFLPESAGFREVPRLHYDFEEYKEKLLSLVAEKRGEDYTELPGDALWNNDNIHLYNGMVTRVRGDLTVENSLDHNGAPLNPLIFEGVLIVDGKLIFRHYRHEDSGSEQLIQGIIIAGDIECTYEDPAELPPGSADTHLEIEGVIMADNRVDIITKGSGGEDIPADHRIIRGTVIAGEVALEGPYTKLYHGRKENLIPAYTDILPDTGVIIRKLFKPYLTE